MPKSIFYLAFLLVVSCAAPSGRIDRSVGLTLPSIKMMMIDSSTYFDTNSISMSAPVVMLFFDPYCDFCRAEVKSILGSMDQFKDVEFCFLTAASIKDVRSFNREFDLNKYNNIHLGIDTGLIYLKFYNINRVPHTSVYSNGRKVKKAFASKVDASEILSALKD
ncbi:peroxiredoxin family protein [Chitinophaga sp. 22536]|uniref:peroxiredoxin family protein n=1 Tax=unclassified Chitinophaga TaxID=2619133 RepID=UPI003F87B07D